VRPFDPASSLILPPIVPQTVLICDDTDFIRTLMRDILQRAGFDVVGEAHTGAQAVEKFKELRPDLVTMDIVMPDMSGIDAVRAICGVDPDARILMCSAVAQQPVVAEAIRAGAREFVAKPFRPSNVLEAVQRALT
jgi:two-component system, chemotaxis family, chemotaxis protein CheY